MSVFWEDLIWEVAEPSFEQGANDIDVIKFMLVEEVDIAL